MIKEILKDRADLLKRARQFFDERHVLEVDVPILSVRASIDAHIDLITAHYNDITPCYLHSSPEYGMKRLIAEGSGDIYQISHVFRDREFGQKHNPEFMMAEWYRLGFTFQQLIDETIEFIKLFLGPLSVQQKTYRQTFLDFLNFDPLAATTDEIISCLKQKNISIYDGLEKEGRDACLNLALATLIEPQLGEKGLYVLSHYPSTQAALAQTLHDGTAERFEVYYQGVELCNGYHELADAVEQEKRLQESNAHRLELNKLPLPIDQLFLSALKKGMPPCCGVAVGFDRLMMLRHKAATLSEVIPFSWEKA